MSTYLDSKIDCVFVPCHIDACSEFKLSKCLDVQELFAPTKRDMPSELSDCNGNLNHNYVVRIPLFNCLSFNCLVKLVEYFSWVLST